MRKLFFLVAAAALSAACHNRSDEEVGAAPDQGRTDTTAVTHEIDSTRTGPPGVGGRPGNATVTADSVGADSASMQGGAMDSTSMGQDTSMTATPQDTLGPRDTGADTSSMGTDTTGIQADTTSMNADTTQTDTTSSNQ
jgi:type IV pilus biogenesis protein CpaD/CtpE